MSNKSLDSTDQPLVPHPSPVSHTSPDELASIDAPPLRKQISGLDVEFPITSDFKIIRSLAADNLGNIKIDDFMNMQVVKRND